MSTTVLARRRSLRFQMPVMMSAFIAVVLATFLWVAFREVRSALLQAGGVRAQGAASQLADLLAQSAQQRLTDIQSAARSAEVRNYLRHPDDATVSTARQRLTALAGPGQPAVELLDGEGQALLVVTRPAPAGTPEPSAFPAVPSPPHPGLSPFRVSGGTVFWEVVAEVRDEADPATESSSGGRLLGYVFSRRLLSLTSSSDAIGRLVGSGAVLALGNQDGSAWMDLAKVVAPPPVNVRESGVAEYRAPDGHVRLGATALVRGTPWAAWVEFPRAAVVAPARIFLARMVLFGLCFVAAAAFVARALSARITTPLHHLTHAAEAIAAGDSTQRVPIERRDEIGRLGAAFNTMAAQVQDVRRDLENRVQQRTVRLEQTAATLEERVSELDALTQELEAFSYSVSHDLRAPLRHVTGFASLLQRSAGQRLEEKETRYLQTIVEAASRMGRLIDDLLAFSRMGRTPIQRARIGLSDVVRDALKDLPAVNGGHEIAWTLHPLPKVDGDPAMLRQVFLNLLSNAAKYSGVRARPTVEVGIHAGEPDETIIYVRDNGVGFDMQYAHNLFGVFQRLHSSDDFEGTGIGLANVRRIVQRHGGRVWAEGVVDGGATFFFSLPATGAHP